MRANKLFYAVVVLGASITGGCGGDDAPEPGEDAGMIADAGGAIDTGAGDTGAGDTGAGEDAGGPADAGREEDGMVLIL